MKRILLSMLKLGSILSQAQIDVAGSANCKGGISVFYHDQTEDLLYGVGTVSNAGGQDVNGVVAWNGTDWVAKGDKSMLTGTGLNVQKGIGIAKNKDTLYIMGDAAMHPTENWPYSLLMYWDETARNWKSKDYGVLGVTNGLVSHNDTLFAYGNLSGGLGATEDQTKYASLGSVAYWTGSRWVAVPNRPSDWYDNPTGAVSHNGALYMSNYMYKNGVWTKLFDAVDIKSMGLWNDKIVYGIETGNNDTNYVKTYDGSKLETIGTFNHNLTDIAVVKGKLAVCGNFDAFAGLELKEIALYDGSTWSGYDNFNATINTIGGCHNQLLITSTEGYGFIYRMKPDTTLLGSIAVQGGALMVSTQDNFNVSEATLFPNPTNGVVNLGTTSESVSVYSVDGQLQISVKNVSQINLENLKPGSYFVTVQNGESVTTTQVVKY